MIAPGGLRKRLVQLRVMLVALLMLAGGGVAQAQESGPPYPPVVPGRALESWRNARIEVGLAYQYDDKADVGVLPVWRARRRALPALAAAE